MPARDDVPDFLHLPPFPHPLPGESIAPQFSQLLAQGADRRSWLNRLAASKADYLFVARVESVMDPPELAFAQSDPTHFQPAFASEHAVVFKIVGR